MMFGFGLLMLVFWVLVIAGVVSLVATLARSGTGTSITSAQGQTPLEILKARYAKGEITKEQLEEMKRDLA